LSEIQVIVDIRHLDFTLRDRSRCSDNSATPLRRNTSLHLRHVYVKSGEIGSLLHSQCTALSAACNIEPCRHSCR